MKLFHGKRKTSLKIFQKQILLIIKRQTFNTDLESDWSLRRSRHLLLCLNGRTSWAAKNKIVIHFFQSINEEEEEAMQCSTVSAWRAIISTQKRPKNLSHHRILFHWKARGVGWYVPTGLSFLEAKNKIPPKKLTASGTNRFDKDTYCKRKLTMNTLTFLHNYLFSYLFTQWWRKAIKIGLQGNRWNVKPLLTTFPLNRLRLEGCDHG